MKNLRFLSILAILLVAALVLISCSKDDKKPTAPPTPDFEEYYIQSSLWNYQHVLWFDLQYQDDVSGLADVFVSMSARGEDDTNYSLTIGAREIDFGVVTSYTKGKIYSWGEIGLSTDQPVSYKINKIVNGVPQVVYQGSVTALPKKINVATWPPFNENMNYAPSWDIDLEPNFHVIEAYAGNWENCGTFVRQIPGSGRNYTLYKSFWEPFGNVTNFTFGINAISFELQHKYKVLIVGNSNTSYDWNNGEDGNGQAPRKPGSQFRFMDKIEQEIVK